MSGLSRVLSLTFCVMAAMVLFACAPKEYPAELMQAKAALADSKSEGALASCPEEFSSAEAMLQKAEALWAEKEDSEMKVAAQEAEKLAMNAKECAITKASTVSASATGGASGLPPELADFSESIYFAYNDNSITMDEANKLKNVAAFIKDHQDSMNFWVILRAHTDRPGNAVENYELSRRRGIVTRFFLIDRGVDGERILIKPMGNQQALIAGKKKQRNPEFRKVLITLSPYRFAEGTPTGTQ